MSQSPESVLKAVDAILGAFGESFEIPADRAEAAAGGDRELLAQALDFLRNRDLVLFAAEELRLFHVRRLVATFEDFVRRKRAVRAEELNLAFGLPSAITFQILGWLDRDGCIVLASEDDGIVVRHR